MSITVSRDRNHRYSVVTSGEALSPAGPLRTVLEDCAGELLVVVDEAIWPGRGARIQALLSGTPHRILTLAGGERNKNLDAVLRVVAAMDEVRVLRRSSPVLAIGGGVLCDLVGFAASIYRRGVPYVRVPTTLLAQVDVSAAIKTGIDHNGFRNRLGAFWPAALTVVDHGFLATQSVEQISQGLGEVFKLGLIASEELFGRLARLSGDWTPEWFATDPAAAELMNLALEVMVGELSEDLWEQDLARRVDFGHSFSPLIELRTGLHHGHAVALDCLLSASIAAGRGLLAVDALPEIAAVMRRCALPVRHPGFADVDLLWETLTEVTRHRDGAQHLPVPIDLGKHAFLEDLTRAELAAAVARLRQVV
ncbi:sedoheptulose 7-phosphate cyclase [Actinospica durhamensis]|uniref:2-epi-5-epi-valiolone synthase n=1 Tax=Actinospica durhamensis TaxID=1508375 RepID=A0A941ETA8_9ACTN|nr:sedoheptulose 7-phosphate cyclase [Actinospica durhamensis]MBR7836088.1 sedoheptulose 7-phosphate cyclase [Actinospica durhamensis]